MKKLSLLLILSICLFFGGCITSYDYENAKSYNKGKAIIENTISEIDIDWVAGNVLVEYTDNEKLSFDEISESELSEKYQVHYLVQNQKLSIKFAKSGLLNLSNIKKSLTVFVPRDFNISCLNIESVSANVEINDLKGTNLDIETVSGKIKCNNVSFSSNVDLESVSGNIIFRNTCEFIEMNVESVSGEIDIDLKKISKFDIESTSGDIKLQVLSFNNFEIETTSGDIDLYFADNFDFGIEIKCLSDVVDNLGLRKNGKLYHTENGVKNAEIETVSGDISLNKIASN